MNTINFEFSEISLYIYIYEKPWLAGDSRASRKDEWKRRIIKKNIWNWYDKLIWKLFLKYYFRIWLRNNFSFLFLYIEFNSFLIILLIIWYIIRSILLDSYFYLIRFLGPFESCPNKWILPHDAILLDF